MNKKIPHPITFNTHKHHFQFLLKQIKRWRKQEWKEVEEELISIGENLIDFYTGDLSAEDICNECSHFCKINDINRKITLLKWLYPQEYRKIKLSDTSEWVVKSGKDHNRYVHIHPAKYSPHTIRVRGTTLKTVLALMANSVKFSVSLSKNLQSVNNIRTAYLHLSPIKSLTRNKGIWQLWELFVKHYQPHYY